MDKILTWYIDGKEISSAKLHQMKHGFFVLTWKEILRFALCKNIKSTIFCNFVLPYIVKKTKTYGISSRHKFLLCVVTVVLECLQLGFYSPSGNTGHTLKHLDADKTFSYYSKKRQSLLLFIYLFILQNTSCTMGHWVRSTQLPSPASVFKQQWLTNNLFHNWLKIRVSFFFFLPVLTWASRGEIWTELCIVTFNCSTLITKRIPKSREQRKWLWRAGNKW